MALKSATEHARIILSAIIPTRRDLLDRALRDLNPEHFPDQTLSNLFIMLERYANVTGSVLTSSALQDLLSKSGQDASRIAYYVEVYEHLSALVVEDSEFLWSLEQIRDMAAEKATGAVLTEAMGILTQGGKDTRGADVKGHAEARTHILTRFAEIDRSLAMQESPEGNMRHEADDIMARYADRKRLNALGMSDGYKFGIPPLDDVIGGSHSGELVLVIGWTSDGKTSSMISLAHHVAITQGFNVVYVTAENLRDQVQDKLLCRHSLLPQFDLPDGLDSIKLKRGTLSDKEEPKLDDIVNDFTSNPKYGNVYVAQASRGATISSLEGMLLRRQREFEVHVVVVDYLQLWKSDQRQGFREDMSTVVKDSKQLATTFDGGRGITLVSPWQVNRPAKEIADREGYYTLASTSETAEASNSPDLIISMLNKHKSPSRYSEISAQVLKNRGGLTSGIIDLHVDYSTCSFTGTQRTNNVDDLFVGSNNSTILSL